MKGIDVFWFAINIAVLADSEEELTEFLEGIRVVDNGYKGNG